MNGLRKLMWVFLTAAVALLALPATAANPQKIYSMRIDSTAAPRVGITITNETPDGNSTINSFVITPAEPVTLASIPASAPASVTLGADGKIYVNGFDGLKAGTQTPKSITIYVNTSLAGSGPVCGTYRWSAKVYTGNSFGQTEFAQVDWSTKQLVAAPGGVNQGQNCTIAFTPPPPNSGVNNTALSPAVGITAYDGSGNPLPWNGSVTWTLNPQSPGATGTVAGTTFTTCTGSPSCSTYLFADLKITSSTGGSFTLTATTQLGATSASTSVTSTAFTVYQGVLNCGDTMDLLYTNPGGGAEGTPGYAEGMRWGNKDGSGCVPVNYAFTNTILTNNTVKLVWDTGTQPNAVFDYTVFWRPEFVDPDTGFPKRRTRVAWEVNGSGTPKWVWGNACISKDPPAQYTTVASDTGTTLVVSSSPALPAIPFAVVIGTERLTVTNVAGTTWTVVRGAGGTTAVTHSSGAKVMSTPLPLDPNPLMADGVTANPYYKKQAHMCIWEEAFQSWVPGGANLYDCATQPTPTPPLTINDIRPVACVLRKTSVFDIGDGFMSLD